MAPRTMILPPPEGEGATVSRQAPGSEAEEPPSVVSPCPACGRTDVTVIEVGPRAWTREAAPR
jgi:hypothetical protein